MLCLGYRRVGLGYQGGLGGVALHPGHYTLYQLAPTTVVGTDYYVIKQLLPPDAAARSHAWHLLLCAIGSGSVFGFQR